MQWAVVLLGIVIYSYILILIWQFIYSPALEPEYEPGPEPESEHESEHESEYESEYESEHESEHEPESESESEPESEHESDTLSDMKSFIVDKLRQFRSNEYIDYKRIFPGYSSLNRVKLGNLLVSSGRLNHGVPEETVNWRIMKLIRKFPTYGIVRFFISMPITNYEIRGIYDLNFIAKGTSNKFGNNLRLAMNKKAISYISDHEIIKSVNKAINSGRLWSKLRSLYSDDHFELSAPNESKAGEAFVVVLKTICSCLGLRWDPQETIHTRDSPLVPSGSNVVEHLTPDGLIYNKDGKIICVVEMKAPALFTKRHRSNPGTEDLCTGNMAGIIMQLQAYMVVTSVRYGIVCDAHHLIPIEFNKSYCKGTSTERKRQLRVNDELVIPFRTKLVNNQSCCPSLLEVLVYMLTKANNDDGADFYSRLPIPLVLTDTQMSDIEEGDSSHEGEEPGDEKHKGSSNNNRSKKSKGSYACNVTPSDTQLLDPPLRSGGRHVKSLGFNCGAEMLQRSENHMTSVYIIKARFLKDVILEKVDDDDDLVLKIYDPFLMHDPLAKRNNRSVQELIRKCYYHERDSIKKVFEVKGYNNIYLKHKEIEVHYWQGYGKMIIGNAIISRYIKSKPITPDVYDGVKKQLQVIHSAGVIHGDVRLPNLLCNEKVYVFDFSHSESMEKLSRAKAKDMIKEDFKSLDEEFEELRYECNITEMLAKSS